MITNYRDSYSELDERIRSRLSPEFLFFRAYNEQEIGQILQQRREYAFVPSCWDEDAFKEVIEKCAEVNDIRIGLFLMREAGNLAEEKGSRRIIDEHVALSIQKVDDFHIKPKEGLDEDLQVILEMIRDHTGKRIGDIFAAYCEMGGELSYKSFQRRILKLEEAKFIATEKQSGKEGNTTIIHHIPNRKLTEF
ncbi:hypothetical protein HY496_03125 [Candidatus Woesearchaeota archaeon]|nr:hypothetical protein [Candidatus Woesearchaeota archaeon]